MRPYKKFQHFLKMPGYFFRKTEIKRKGAYLRRSPTYPTAAHLARPSPASSCRHPPLPPQQLGGGLGARRQPPRRGEASRPPQALTSRHVSTQKPPRLSPHSRLTSSPALAGFLDD